MTPSQLLGRIIDRRRAELDVRAAELLAGFHPADDPAGHALDVRLLSLALMDAYLDGARDTFEATDDTLRPLWKLAGFDS